MLLQLKNLAVGFDTERGLARAVDDVSFSLPAGGSLCLVGESGCGKSVTALSLLRLLPSPPARFLAGEALFAGRDLLGLPEAELTRLRGSSIGMIFQEPMTSLNPVFRVGEQVAEPLILHRGLARKAALGRAVELLEQVGIAQAGERALDYPHQLSGGQRQRVMIAMAMACGPALLIADEPTTALDVSVQGQILELLRGLRRDHGAALLLITHDLEVAAASAESLAVMYAGKIVELGRTGEVLAAPLHPYTRGLIASRPRLPDLAGMTGRAGQAGAARGDGRAAGLARLAEARRGRLEAIPGTVPPPLERPAGCAFAGRCPQALEHCRREMPPLRPAGPDVAALAAQNRLCRCWL